MNGNAAVYLPLKLTQIKLRWESKDRLQWQGKSTLHKIWIMSLYFYYSSGYLGLIKLPCEWVTFVLPPTCFLFLSCLCYSLGTSSSIPVLIKHLILKGNPSVQGGGSSERIFVQRPLRALGCPVNIPRYTSESRIIHTIYCNCIPGKHCLVYPFSQHRSNFYVGECCLFSSRSQWLLGVCTSAKTPPNIFGITFLGI